MSPRSTTILQKTTSRAKFESVFAYIALFCFTIGLIGFTPVLTVRASSSEGSFTSRPTQFTISGNSETITYAEYDNGGQFMELAGNLTGFNMDVRLPFSNDVIGWDYLFGEVGGGFSSGQLLYNGATWGGDPINDRPSNDQIYNLSGSIGGTYDANDVVIESFAGASLKRWNNKIEDGYRREITQYFWTGGASLRFGLGRNLAVGIGGEGRNLISGAVTSYLSDVDSSYNDPTVTQDEGYGIKGSLDTWFNFLGTTVKLEAFTRYLYVADSDYASLTSDGAAYTEVYEPRNKTTIYGISAGLVWGSV